MLEKNVWLLLFVGLVGCGDSDCPAGFTMAGSVCLPNQLDGGLEICNGEDDDLDGQIDENNAGGGAECGSDEGTCSVGALSCVDGELICAGEVTPVEEVCDDLDNDCDGNTDEGLVQTLYQDLDEDGVGSSVVCEMCGECEGEGPWVTATGDCDDTCATCSPLEVEICDGQDNDCDEAIDESTFSTFYQDLDGDGVGTAVTCEACEATGCSGSGAWVVLTGDCNDECPTCYPDHDEICDTEDNDCDAMTDEGVSVLIFPDGDEDGYGRGEGEQGCRVAGVLPAGFVTTGGDCADGDARAHPGVVGYLNGPLVGVVSSGLRYDYNCDGMEEQEHLACTSCVRGACWRAIGIDGVDYSATPSCGEPAVRQPGAIVRGVCLTAGSYEIIEGGATCR